MASRLNPGTELRRFVQLDVLQLGPLSETAMVAMLQVAAPNLAEDVVSVIVTLANGNPLFARLVARPAQHRSSPGEVFGDHLDGLIGTLVDYALSASPDRDLLGLILEELALAGGRDRISALAGKMRIPEDQVRRVLGNLPEFSLLTFDQQAGTIAFAHAFIQEAVLSQRVYSRPFRLAELRFGAEEAERDDLLDASFVG
ncbi:hypothetical protein ABZS68_37965 [Streptomyces sp. NPDC005571]|uniref:hypothetical protein n=1 Tax=Streptomyces sp. NPDC005571 TaxID=3156888 RepID=UPI0033AD62ED